MGDKLGDRMKRYEDVSRTVLTPRMPVIVRVDGRAFHTRGFLRPFDSLLRNTMVEAARKVAKEMHGFELAYQQSDEVSFLLTDYANIDTSAWFDYVNQKVCTISASVMTAWFNRLIDHNVFPPRKSIGQLPPREFRAHGRVARSTGKRRAEPRRSGEPA